MENKMTELRKKWAEGDAKRDAGVIDPENIVRHTDLPYGPHLENLLDVLLIMQQQQPLYLLLQ